MYSAHWFHTFARSVDTAATAAEIAAITSICPQTEFPRLLELGCGTGRIAGPLASLGYQVSGIDISDDALRVAQQQAPGPTYIALDQRRVGKLNTTFDAALVMWNSLGFTTRADDEVMLRGVANVLRPGGMLLLDLYHPDWLRDHGSAGATDSRGATVDRWLRDGRLFHNIRYADGTVDDIQFNVYAPEEMRPLLSGAGFTVASEMTWWSTAVAPNGNVARYQLACVRN